MENYVSSCLAVSSKLAKNVKKDKSSEVEKILKKKTVVNIKNLSSIDLIVGMVENIEDDNVFISLHAISDKFIKDNLTKGSKISCHYIEGDYELVIYGIISDIIEDYPRVIQVLVSNIRKFKNKRN